MHYEVGHTVRIGNRPSNQDRVGVATGDGNVLLVLADGLGGYADGELAAQTLVDSVIEAYRRTSQPITQPLPFLDRLIRSAHAAVIDAGHRQTPPSKPCTTCVVCLVQKGTAWWAHVGDSRLYLLRQRTVVCRTRDHSYVEELCQQGLLRPGETVSHPKRNYITQCIGGTERQPRISHGPSTSLERADIILLCSDGLWSAVDEMTLAERLAEGELHEAVNDIAYQAEQVSYPHSDNISAVAFRWDGNRSYATPAAQGCIPCPQQSATTDAQMSNTSMAIREIERALEEFGHELKRD